LFSHIDYRIPYSCDITVLDVYHSKSPNPPNPPNPSDPSDPSSQALAGQIVPPTTFPSYNRTLIDTGPNTKAGLKNLINVLTSYGQPATTTTSGKPSLPTNWKEAFVGIFEVRRSHYHLYRHQVAKQR
jgi:hypothetical protein